MLRPQRHRDGSACPGAPTPGEQLLLSAVRVWAHARVQGQRPHAHVAQALAARASRRVGALFVAWMQALEAASLRPIQIRCPDCGGLSSDEERLIVACGLAPVSMDVAERLLAPLLRDPGVPMTLARSLNAAMAADGWPLPARLDDPAQPRPTLH